MLYEIARWFFGMVGLMPAREAVAYAELGNELTALGAPSDSEARLDIIRTGIEAAKAGVGSEEIRPVLSSYARYGLRGEYDLLRIRRYIDTLLSENGHLPNE